MKTFGSVKEMLVAAAFAVLLGGCTSSGPQIAPSAGGGQSVGATSHQLPLKGIPAPDDAKRGIYVGEYSASSVLGYKSDEKKNEPPICTVPGISGVNGIAVDDKGNLIAPTGSHSVLVFQGPGMCGAQIASLAESYGQPVDAASANALTGTIAVGIIFDGNNPGSILVCTVKAGCTTNLTNASINEMLGVAMDNKGNCWGSGYSSGSAAVLVYFAKCAGGGQVTTGFVNGSVGGLDIDPKGNLVSIDGYANNTGAVYVYSGCKPTCTRLGGPFPLLGKAVRGHLNKKGTAFAAMDYDNKQVDVYSYSPTSLAYKYSFNNGISPSLSPLGIAYSPRAKE
ncbi:MAG: hypothetical protein WA431_11685 [Candidatus Cybelea sp.]